MRTGATWLLEQFQARVAISGAEHVPADGPVLLVANHPGLSDSLAFISSTPRSDVKVVVGDYPFFRALSATRAHLVHVNGERGRRVSTVRESVTQLGSGGALLTFPRGGIEPDPALLPGAKQSLEEWSSGIGLLARLVPSLQIVPTAISGVLSARAQSSPLVHLRRHEHDRQKLAAMLQLIVPAYRSVTVRVKFGLPMSARQYTADSRDEITAAVAAEAAHLIEAL